MKTGGPWNVLRSDLVLGMNLILVGSHSGWFGWVTGKEGSLRVIRKVHRRVNRSLDHREIKDAQMVLHLSSTAFPVTSLSSAQCI